MVCLKRPRFFRLLWILAAAAAVTAAALLLPKERPVITCGDFSMTNTQLGYYYWSEYFYFSQAYGEYLSDSVDFDRPLQDQPYDGSRTWQDYLLEETLAVVGDTMSLVFRAEETGFTMPEEYETAFRSVWESFVLKSDGDLEAYLRRSYGRHANADSFRQYLRHAHLSAAYADSLYAQITLTEADIAAYAQSHRGEYLDAGLAESQWLTQAREDLLAETYRGQLRAIRNSYTFLVDESRIVITPPEGLYEE